MVLMFLITSVFVFAHDITIDCSSKCKSHTKHEHTYYELCFTENNCPEYVVWTLTKKQVEQAEANKERKDNFRPCELGSVTLNDYKGSGYDRGHMCPFADMDFNAKAGDETFLLCNMCPQIHTLNAGVWADLEKQDRLYAKMKSKITVACGPIFEGTDKYVGKQNKIKVPTAYWRVFFNSQTNFIECWIVDAKTEKARKVEYKEIERLTGLKFHFNRTLQKGGKIVASNVAPASDKPSKAVITAASRASDAKEDLAWDEM